MDYRLEWKMGLPMDYEKTKNYSYWNIYMTQCTSSFMKESDQWFKRSSFLVITLLSIWDYQKTWVCTCLLWKI